MSIEKINPRTIVITLFILVIAIFRTLTNMSGDLGPINNFSPLGAMAIFGGACFKSRGKAFGFPLLVLFISDVVLSATVYKQYSSGLLYGGWYWTYASFILMVIAGKYIIKDATIKNILIAAVSVTFIHWIVSDIGVWLPGIMYPKTAAGFGACLVAAIPYEINFLGGTLLYGSILFGGFELLQKRYTSLKWA